METVRQLLNKIPTKYTTSPSGRYSTDYSPTNVQKTHHIYISGNINPPG